MTINNGVGGDTSELYNSQRNLGSIFGSAGSFLRKRYRSARDLNDEEFLSLFDIPEVNQRIGSGLNIKATAALLNHFKERVQDGWLNPPSQLIDMAFDISEATDDEVVARAELVLDYDLEWSGVPPEINHIGEIDWQRNILQNSEWLFRINRHGWWPLLGHAYQCTGDERFAKAFAQQLSAWINNNFPLDTTQVDPHLWGTEQVALRLRVSWIPAFGMFYHSPYFNTTRKLEMLRSIFDQARFLKQSTEQNDVLLSSGLVSAGVTFPEMREARKWRKIAMQRCRSYLRNSGEQQLDNLIEVGDQLHAKSLVEMPA